MHIKLGLVISIQFSQDSVFQRNIWLVAYGKNWEAMMRAVGTHHATLKPRHIPKERKHLSQLTFSTNEISLREKYKTKLYSV